MADELIDILDENGLSTGKTAMKNEAHRKGLWHAAAHVWIFNDKKEILLQHRSKEKKLFPDLWDVCVGGHISAGGNPKDTALREAKEELGMDLDGKLLKKAFIFKESTKANDGQQNNEFYHTFLYKLKKFPKIKMQKGEVDATKIISTEELEKELHDKEKSKKYLPHEKEYWFLAIKNIKK
ncbi:MAG: NUDIX domain-containing protein [archaeon]|jgi:isopentenyldiphosphate isomerase